MKVSTGKTLVAEQVSSVKHAALRAKIARAHQARITTTAKFIESVTQNVSGIDSCYSWLDVNVYAPQVILRISVSATVKSMKEGIVPQLLRVLMNAGFDPTKTEDYCSEYSGTREFELVRSETSDHVKTIINFCAKVSGADDATCRKVQVGTQIKEVPVYKLECPDATAEEIAAA